MCCCKSNKTFLRPYLFDHLFHGPTDPNFSEMKKKMKSDVIVIAQSHMALL